MMLKSGNRPLMFYCFMQGIKKLLGKMYIQGVQDTLVSKSCNIAEILVSLGAKAMISSNSHLLLLLYIHVLLSFKVILKES